MHSRACHWETNFKDLQHPWGTGFRVWSLEAGLGDSCSRTECFVHAAWGIWCSAVRLMAGACAGLPGGPLIAVLACMGNQVQLWFASGLGSLRQWQSSGAVAACVQRAGWF